MNRRRLVLLAAAALVGRAAAAPASAQSVAATGDRPVDVVRRIYAFSAGKTGAWDGPSAYFDADTRRATFSAAFNAAIDAEAVGLDGDVGVIDFDPISNSQDPAVHALALRELEASGDRARVEARFRTGPEADAHPVAVVYRLVREPGGWRVDDIVPRGDDGSDFSVREALADALRDRQAPPAPVKTR